jgi:Oxidoreductase family, NAD-binding Rossmann fold
MAASRLANDPLRVVLVGPNRRRHGTGPFLLAAAAEAGIEVIGIAASSLDSARAAIRDCKLSGRCQATKSASELFGLTGAEAALVASPTMLHRTHLELALGHNLPVFTEKPVIDLAHPQEEVDRLMSNFRKRGLPLHVNYYWLHVIHTLRDQAVLPDIAHARRVSVELRAPLARSVLIRSAIGHFASVLAVGRIRPERALVTVTSSSVFIQGVGSSPTGEVIFESTLDASSGARSTAVTIDGVRVERVLRRYDSATEQFHIGGRDVPLSPARTALARFREAVETGSATDGLSQLAWETESLGRWFLGCLQAEVLDSDKEQ